MFNFSENGIKCERTEEVEGGWRLMRAKLLEMLLIGWIVIVLAVHWVLLSGPRFQAAIEGVWVLRAAREMLLRWFYAPYGS
jgi:hypothetical protein